MCISKDHRSDRAVVQGNCPRAIKPRLDRAIDPDRSRIGDGRVDVAVGGQGVGAGLGEVGLMELARSVYKSNDHRAALKRKINELLGSVILEEKSYDDAQ
jgi:hypothetical protein